MQATWGSDGDVAELNRLFDLMQEFCKRNDLPAFIGEFGVTDKKEAVSRVRWMTAVAQAALDRRMVPVLWDTGGDISRNSPHTASPALQLTLRAIGNSTPSKAEGPDAQEVVKELGAVLGWRLSPEAVEEHCRSADPDGAAARNKLLQEWLTKNDALIKSVDSRVAEVVALLEPKAKPDDLVASLQAQVKKLILEGTFTGKTADESRAICKAEADPAAPRWKNNGVRNVQQSLAALYDWTVIRSTK
jgi:hypothetical protein